jgi:hypothetical protein
LSEKGDFFHESRRELVQSGLLRNPRLHLRFDFLKSENSALASSCGFWRKGCCICANLGIDYGTNSVRALFVDVSDGRELAACGIDYPTGKQGILFEPRAANLARQRMASGSFICSMRRRAAATIGAADQISIRVLSKSCLPPDTALTVASATRAKAAISSTLVLK